MKKSIKRLFIIGMACLVMTAMMPVMAFATGGAAADAPQADKWQTSKSKTATNLDKSLESEITLSLPAAEEKLVSDVVFVFDESSCSEPVKEEVKDMLAALYQQIKGSGAAIKIGAVQFRGEVTEFSLTELTDTTKDAMEQFMSERPETGGSNMSAGLIAAKAMLDNDKEVSSDRKHVILVSDGITYIWDDETTEEQENYGVNFSNIDFPERPMLASPDGWDVRHGAKYVPESWDAHIKQTEALLEKTVKAKASKYVRGKDISGDPFVAPEEKNSYAGTVDIALYKSYKAYQEIAEEYPNTYSIMTGVESEMQTYPFGPSFMEYLSGGKKVTFDKIQNDIYYLLDKDSMIIDEIGFGKDNAGNDYDFEFVDKASALAMKVGEKELKAEQASYPMYGATTTYLFGKTDDGGYRFALNYCKDGIKADEEGAGIGECFILHINEAVSRFAPVQLTYKVKLTNPAAAAGIYGEYDADGSEGKKALYTNNNAVLFPMSTDGMSGEPEIFNKPTVSYEVKSAPASGEPQGDKPSDGAAATGDDSNMLPAIIAMVVAAAAGLAVCGRKLFMSEPDR